MARTDPPDTGRKHRPVLRTVTGEEEDGHQLECSCGLWLDDDGDLPEGESFMRHAERGNRLSGVHYDHMRNRVRYATGGNDA